MKFLLKENILGSREGGFASVPAKLLQSCLTLQPDGL